MAPSDRADCPVPPLSPGSTLADGYTVIGLLSRGNDLDVYDAWSAALEARCVVKTLRPDRLDNPKDVRRLLWEGQLLTTLHHPHLVRGYEVVEEPRPMVAMETITGYTLSALLGMRRARFPLVTLAALGEQLCAALHYLHGRDILHLDLKPGNVVSEAGKAKVIDLSLAHAPGRGPAGWGTPAYMAPEQARGDEFTTASDVWAVGLILYEAATGTQPFDQSGDSDGDSDSASEAAQESAGAVASEAAGEAASEAAREPTTVAKVPRVYHQLQSRADSVRTLRRLPPSFSQTIDRCLDPDPSGRPSVEELLVLFRSFQPALLASGGHPAGAHEPST